MATNDEIIDKYAEDYPDIEGTAIFNENLDKALNEARADERNKLKYKIKNEMLVPKNAYSNLLKKVQEWKNNPYNTVVLAARKQERIYTAKRIFAELDNLHIVENWSTQKEKGIPLLLKQIGTYKFVKKKFDVLK